MATYSTPVAASAADRSTRTLRSGGLLLATAGVLLAIGGATYGFALRLYGIGFLWLSTAWVIGSVLVLAASIVLAAGRAGEDGLVGRSSRARAALILWGIVPMLQAALALLSFGIIPLLAFLIPAVQLLSLVTIVAVVVAVRRRSALAGAARALVGLAIVEAVTLLLTLVPSASGLVAVLVALVHPVVLVVVGMLLARQARAVAAGRSA